MLSATPDSPRQRSVTDRAAPPRLVALTDGIAEPRRTAAPRPAPVRVQPTRPIVLDTAVGAPRLDCMAAGRGPGSGLDARAPVLRGRFERRARGGAHAGRRRRHGRRATRRVVAPRTPGVARSRRRRRRCSRSDGCRRRAPPGCVGSASARCARTAPSRPPQRRSTSSSGAPARRCGRETRSCSRCRTRARTERAAGPACPSPSSTHGSSASTGRVRSSPTPSSPPAGERSSRRAPIGSPCSAGATAPGRSVGWTADAVAGPGRRCARTSATAAWCSPRRRRPSGATATSARRWSAGARPSPRHRRSPPSCRRGRGRSRCCSRGRRPSCRASHRWCRGGGAPTVLQIGARTAMVVDVKPTGDAGVTVTVVDQRSLAGVIGSAAPADEVVTQLGARGADDVRAAVGRHGRRCRHHPLEGPMKTFGVRRRQPSRGG